jgi:hypothetical protein
MTVIGVPNAKFCFLDIGKMSRSWVLMQPVLNIIRSLSCVWLDAFKMIINRVERCKLIPDIQSFMLALFYDVLPFKFYATLD